MTAAMFRSDVFLYSECTWVDAWVVADRGGDEGAKAQATTGLKVVVSKLDEPFRVRLDDNGRKNLHGLVTAAQHDDPGPLRSELKINCGWNFR